MTPAPRESEAPHGSEVAAQGGRIANSLIVAADAPKATPGGKRRGQ